jgi:hypothetical protein
VRVSTSDSLPLFTSPLYHLRVTKFDAPHLRKVSRLGILRHKRRDGAAQTFFGDSPFGNLKKLRVTRELAFEIIQQRKQAYWEFGTLFVTAWGVEENLFANRLL